MKIRVGREDRGHHSIERPEGGDSWDKAVPPTNRMSRNSSQASRHCNGGRGLQMSRSGGSSGRETRMESKCYKMVEGGSCKLILLVARAKQQDPQPEALKREVGIQGYVHTVNSISFTYYAIFKLERFNSCEAGEGESYEDFSVTHGEGKKGFYWVGNSVKKESGHREKSGRKQEGSSDKYAQEEEEKKPGKGDLRITLTTHHLVYMAEGIIKFLYPDGQQNQTYENKGKCNRSQGLSRGAEARLYDERHIHKLTPALDECFQVSERQVMAHSGRGRGRGGRGHPRQEILGGRSTNSSGGQRRGRITTLTAAQEVSRAYQERTDEDIKRIIHNMESSILEEQLGSETEELAKEVTDPGNTRGRMTLYRQSLHIY